MGTIFGNPLRSVDNVAGIILNISANTTLSNASYNKGHLISGTGNYTVTLPLLSTGLTTQTVLIMNDTSTGTSMITANGSDVIRVKGVNQVSVQLPPGEAITLKHNGTQWSLSDTSLLKAPTVSPTFTGTPTAPTAAASTNTTQIATTAFVIGQGSASNPLGAGTATPGVSLTFSKSDHVHPSTGVTQAVGDNSTNLATTNFAYNLFATPPSLGSSTRNSAFVTRLGVGTGSDPGDGNIIATGNITAYYSDERLKDILGPIENALDKVKALTGFYYRPNELAQSMGYKNRLEVGVSAQKCLEVLPEITDPAPINPKYWTVHYDKLAPMLIEAIKELDVKVEAIKQSLAGLKP